MITKIERAFEIKTHNGKITIKSNRTGEHRTVKISTQSNDAKFAPGKRIASLLSGSDNETDYRTFAFVYDGQVSLFSKHRGSPTFEWLASFLEHPERFDDKVEIFFEGTCRRCNRTLTDPLSVELGIGPFCRDMEGQ